MAKINRLFRNGCNLIYGAFLSFLITACSSSAQSDIKNHGEKMSKPTDPNEQVIIVIDYGSKTKKIKPATDFPESMRLLDAKVVIDGKEKIIKVPVKQIQIRPLDDSGNLVDMQNSKIVSIQYLDGEGNTLQSTTMQKYP